MGPLDEGFDPTISISGTRLVAESVTCSPARAKLLAVPPVERSSTPALPVFGQRTRPICLKLKASRALNLPMTRVTSSTLGGHVNRQKENH